MFKNILVAVDGSNTAQRGLKVAAELALDQHATLHIIHVIDEAVIVPIEGGFVPAAYLDSMTEAVRESGRAILAKAEAFATDRGVQARTSMVDTTGHDVAGKIIREATKRKADLIVLGTHGRRGLRRLMLGSDAEMVLRDARVPVLLVRTPDRKRAATQRPARVKTPDTRRGIASTDTTAPGARASTR